MKDVIITSGLPGCGKSTWAKSRGGRPLDELVLHPGSKTAIVSSDYFHMKNGKWEFDPANLPEAHRWCKQQFCNALAHSFALVETVIVDNTNLTPVEAAFYYEFAALHYHIPKVLRFDTDPEVCFARQTHGVSRELFDRMRNIHLSAMWPPYWKVETHPKE